MSDLIKVKGLKGKQNKKKWNKNIDVTGLLQYLGQKHTQKVRQKFATPLVVEAQTDNIRKPLDPERFKSNGTKIPKTKYDNSIKKQSLIDDVQDVWNSSVQIKSKYKKPQVPAVIAPSTGHSYNPNEQGIKQIIDTVIDYQGLKQKKTKKIKKTQFKPRQVRIRNKNLRAQQLAARQRKAAKQLEHEIFSHKKIIKQIDSKVQQIKQKIQQKQQKQSKLQQQARTGRVRYGKKIGKKQYKYRQIIPTVDQVGKKLSHVSVSQALIKQRFDSIYRRGIFEARNIKVHANKIKGIKSKTKYRQDQQKQAKDKINFVK